MLARIFSSQCVPVVPHVVPAKSHLRKRSSFERDVQLVVFSILGVIRVSTLQEDKADHIRPSNDAFEGSSANQQASEAIDAASICSPTQEAY